MPALVPALVGMAVAEGVTAAIGASVVGAGFIGMMAGGLAAGVVAQAMAPTPQTGPSASSQAVATGSLINATASYGTIPVLYGSRRCGGTRVLTEVSGDNNEMLHLVIVWCEGEIGAISTVFLDDVQSDDAKFTGFVTVENHLGADDQVASVALRNALPDKWTDTDTLSGVAYTYVAVKWDQNTFPRGMPTITADIQGRIVYDPRNGVTGPSSNSALCIRDYLLNTRYGWAAPPEMVNDAAIIAAANVCDEPVATPAGLNTQQPRYSCNGLLDIEQTLISNTNGLLSSCRGFLVYTGGQYKLKIDKPETPTSFVLNEDNIIGSWRIDLPKRRTTFNRVTANFIDAANQFQANVGVWDSANARALDGGIVMGGSLDLPFTTDSTRAKQLAMVWGKASRYGIVVSLTATIAAMQLEVGDVVPITHSTPLWNRDLFRVTAIELLSSDEVRLTLTQYATAIYDLDQLEFIKPPPETGLPDPSDIPPPSNLVFADAPLILPDGTVIPRFRITWTPPAYAFGIGYEVRWKSTQDWDWNTTIVYAPMFYIQPVIPDLTYDVQVRTISAFGRSAALEISGHVAVGQTEVPLPITSLTATTGGVYQIALRWIFASSARMDFRYTEVWGATSNALSNAVKLTSVPWPGESFIHAGLTAGTDWYYWVRLVDTSGNVSNWYPAGVNSGVHGVAIGIDFTVNAADIDAALTAAGLRPVKITNTLPDLQGYAGPPVLFLTSDGKLYRAVNGQWVSSVAAADLTGQIQAAMLAGIEASKISGTLSDAQLAEISAAKIAGQVSGAQIAANSIQSWHIVAGTIIGEDIAGGTITGANINGGTITGNHIVGNTITGANIAGGTINAGQIAVGAITAGSAIISDAAISSAQIMSLDAQKITTGFLSADRINAGTITAREIRSASCTALEWVALPVQNDVWQAYWFYMHYDGNVSIIYLISYNMAGGTYTDTFASFDSIAETFWEKAWTVVPPSMLIVPSAYLAQGWHQFWFKGSCNAPTDLHRADLSIFRSYR